MLEEAEQSVVSYIQDHEAIVAMANEMDGLKSTLEDIHSLCRMRDIISVNIDKGISLETTSVKVMTRHINMALKKHQIEQRVIPSLEAFRDKSTTFIASQISLEDISGVIEKLVNNFITVMQSFFEKIKSFFVSLFNRREKVKIEIEELINQIKEIPNNLKPIDEYLTGLTFSTENHNSRDVDFLDRHILFGIEGRCDGTTADRIINNTSTLLVANKDVISEMMKTLRYFSEHEPSQDDIDNEADRLVASVKHAMEHFTVTERKNHGHQVVRSYGYFHDSNVFKLFEDVGKASTEDEVRKFNLDLEIVKTKSERDYKVRILERDQLTKISQDTLKLINQSKAFDTVIPVVEKSVHSVLDKLHRIFLQYSDEEHRLAIMYSMDVVRAILSYVKRYLPKVSSIAVRVASDASTYVRASVNHYKQA